MRGGKDNYVQYMAGRVRPRDDRRAYMKAWKSNPAGKFCACGKPAYVWKGNAWVCRPCFNWEMQYYGSAHRYAA